MDDAVSWLLLCMCLLGIGAMLMIVLEGGCLLCLEGECALGLAKKILMYIRLDFGATSLADRVSPFATQRAKIVH